MHQAEMETYQAPLVDQVAVAVVAAVVLIKQVRLVLQVKVTLVEMAVQQGKIIPAAVAGVLVL